MHESHIEFVPAHSGQDEVLSTVFLSVSEVGIGARPGVRNAYVTHYASPGVLLIYQNQQRVPEPSSLRTAFMDHRQGI